MVEQAKPQNARNLSLSPEADRPMLIKAKNSPGEINRDIAFRLNAVRETFEESGVLIAKRGDQQQLDPAELSNWRSKVRQDPSQFIQRCQQLKLCPDVWSLYE